MNTRLLGIAGVVGGIGLLAVQLRELVESGGAPGRANIDRIDSIGYLVWGLGLAAVMWALYRLGATGQGRLMRLAPLVAFVGFILMAVGSFLDVLGAPRSILDIAAGAAWILILIGTLLTGILALIARTLPGWRRIMPLLCILSILLTFVLGPYAAPLFGLCWILLGVAITSLPTQTQHPLAATAVP